MFIHCKKTGEEYEITDREIGERVECPCCGEKFEVDDTILPADVYTAALIRKTEAIALSDEPVQKIYKHGSEGEYARLFDKAYDEDNADAQFELAKRLFENHKEYALAAFWFGCAAEKKHPEATYRLAECYRNGIGLRKDINRAVEEYRDAAKYGNVAAKELASKFDFAEYRGNDGGGKITFAAVQRMIGEDKKFEQYLCAKYNVKAVVLFWRDEALPEWGVPKGTSFIIGSFASEQDVPREMLNEISRLIGRRLCYSGRYMDDAIVDDKKFLFCYAVSSTFEEDVSDTVETHHLSDLLQQEIEDEGDGYERRITTWRETIDMNCPLCEGEITIPTRLTGSKVRCSHCNGEFWAKGEGIMTTAERKMRREEKTWNEESRKIQRCMKWESSTVSALQLAFKMGGFQVDGQSVGRGWRYPWPGIYVMMWFEDLTEDVAPHVARVREVLESALGFWLRVTKIESGDACGATFYVRQNRPCEQNERMKFEIEQYEKSEKEKAKIATPSPPENPVVVSREAEYDRLEYLVFGEAESSKNRFDFLEFLRKKYHIRVLNVFNKRPGDAFCEMHGFPDGFGMIVETSHALSSEEFANFVKDLEKRFSRKVTLVKKDDDEKDLIKEYIFVPSMIEQNTVKPVRSLPSRSAASPVAAKSKNERGSTMKRNTTATTPQHLGRGTGVDWTKENRAFSEMIARHGISRFHVEMVNPYFVEISIPMVVSRNIVRRFANDLFHALDVLDANYNLDFGQLTDCSGLDLNEAARCYYVLFNHHDVKECRPGDAMYKYKVEVYESSGEDGEDADSDGSGEGALTPAQIMKYIADGIKSGEFRSKSGEGYFVLKGEFYDAIEAGRKTTEYRDLTPRNLSLSIGIKTVKFQRGYGHSGQPPKQMRFEVSSVRLMDASDRECDPYAIPPGFIATTIAIHLGKRIG